MELPLLLPLIGMGISAISSGIQAYQNSEAEELANSNYKKQRRLLLQEKYASPLDSISNTALLSKLDRRLNKTEEAIANQAASKGATVENVLAAKQSSNEVRADAISNILQGTDARRDSYNNMLLNLDSQRTAQQIASKQASGQAWANMGNSIASGLTTLGAMQYETDMYEKLLGKLV